MKKIFLWSPLVLLIFFVTQVGQTQLIPTMLQVRVIDSIGNVVPGAKVTVYASEADFNDEENEVVPFELSNKKGIVTFKKLEAKSYWILAKKGDMSNEDRGVQTEVLEKGRINKINVVLEE